MFRYSVEATRTHYYTVEVNALDEMDAIRKLDDWLADDFEDYETNAQWDFEATRLTETRVCPNHEGAFDCNPFCSVCEGEQEYEYTETRPCQYCRTEIDHDIWFEELGMCVECSNKYYNHEDMETK